MRLILFYFILNHFLFLFCLFLPRREMFQGRLRNSFLVPCLIPRFLRLWRRLLRKSLFWLTQAQSHGLIRRLILQSGHIVLVSKSIKAHRLHKDASPRLNWSVVDDEAGLKFVLEGVALSALLLEEVLPSSALVHLIVLCRLHDAVLVLGIRFGQAFRRH